MPNGLGFSLGDIIDTVSSGLTSLFDFVIQALVDAVNFLFIVADFILELIKSIVSFLERAFTALRNFFRSLWHLGFRGFLSKLWGAFTSIKTFLHGILDPIIRAIRLVIAYQQYLFNLYIRPIFNLIQHMRSLLVFLRLLHVKWAARLDARLAEIEGKISSLALVGLRELNTVRQYLSLILDPFGLFNPAVFVASAIRSITDLVNAFWSSQQRPLTASELDAEARARAIWKGDTTLTSDNKQYFDSLAASVAAQMSDVTGRQVT